MKWPGFIECYFCALVIATCAGGLFGCGELSVVFFRNITGDGVIAIILVVSLGMSLAFMVVGGALGVLPGFVVTRAL